MTSRILFPFNYQPTFSSSLANPVLSGVAKLSPVWFESGISSIVKQLVSSTFTVFAGQMFQEVISMTKNIKKIMVSFGSKWFGMTVSNQRMSGRRVDESRTVRIGIERLLQSLFVSVSAKHQLNSIWFEPCSEFIACKSHRIICCVVFVTKV